MVITMERLQLRDFTQEEFELFSSVYSDKEIMKFAYMDAIESQEEMRRFFNKVLGDAAVKDDRTMYELAVIDRIDGTFHGVACIIVEKKNDSGGVGEIGYFLRKSSWGRGFATEIARALIDYCFKSLHLHKVHASCNILNHNSENIMKKCGMTREGLFRKVRYKNGAWFDELRYGILREE